MEDYRLSQTGQEVQDILNGAAMQVDLNTEVERATDAEGTLQSNIDVEERARQDADGLLQQGIDDEAQRAKDAEEANAGEIEGIKALIPSTASEANKLADTNYVNSSIQTATAEYRGDYNVVTDLHLAIDATHAQIETLLPTVIAEADKNDYCYVMIPTSAQTPTEIAKIERYKMTSEEWKFEYDVNNSTFTAEEWAAIKSGVTSGLVAKLNALPTNADLLLLLAGKQDVLTFDSVPVPESNNPVKSGGVYSAIDDEKTARLNSDTAIHTELDGLQAKVPATASSDNKLVDQNQMNSSISTATATFRGDWNVVSDLHLAVDATRAQIAALLPTVISTADNNDYCYVEIPTSAETPAQIERVERYKFNGTAWGYEYTLNNSGFTADQWAAINSMITSGLVAKLSALPTNADLLAMLAQKQDNLTFDSTPTENSTNPVTSGGVFAADKALSDAIEAILLLIPSAASSLNKLVDTALLNSSISTATATFRGTYNLVSDLGLGIDATEGQIAAALLSAISTADNNDYAFVQIPTSAEAPAQIARTDRYKFNGTAWAFEYTLNTSGFTAAQWAAINSTITSALVAKLNALPTAAELQEALGTLTSGITAINQKIPSTASQSNKLVDNASMESYITQVINILDASFNVTSTDGHITLHITQVDGVITSVQVQSTDIASAANLALKASQADLTALASRVTTAEGNITSLTGRMGTAETNIANLQQLYNNLQQSKPVPITVLPSTGQQQGVVYRLAGTTSYSDYMWNGSSWVLMATYNNAIDPRPKKASQNLVTSGGVFDNIGALDVSELNATENPHTLAQYADLSSALAAIPTDYQKGGMSVKFVQSSDNKYVQYRLMSDTFNTTVANWQGVDITLLAGSKNFVENAAVTDMFGRVVMESLYLDDVELTGTPTTLEPTTTRNGYYDRNTKQFVTTSSFTYNEYIIVNENYYEILNKQTGGDSVATIVLYKDDTPIYFGRLADNALIKIKAKDVIKIGLNSSSSYIKHYDGIENKIKDDTITIKKIEFKDFVQGTNRANPASCTYKRYIDRRDGVAVYIDYEQTQLQRYVTDYIPVSVNGLYCGGFEVFGNEGRGAVYDASKNYIRGINSEVYTYQEGDAYVRWTVSVSSVETPTLYVIEGTEAGQYTPYVAPKQVIKKQYIPELDGDNIEDGSITTEKIASDTTIPTTLPALSLCGKDCIKATADSITAGGNLRITAFPQYLKGNAIVSFYGKISNFDNITLGFGSGDTNSIQIKIDDTNIYIYKSGSLIGSAVPHGLTISDFVDITFNNDIFGISVVLASVSGLFKHTFAEYVSLESYGYPRVELGTTTVVINAELRATSPYFSKPIWVFGDSYTSLYDERWTKQMIKTIGITDFLLDGLAGGSSGELYGEVTKAFNFGTPKFLIWCLGMNDTYENWNTIYQTLKTLCDSKGIELILQTIPIPNLETSQQQADINTAIKASGLRYIDACDAMCPNNTWPWYTGYCDDGVHPTELGAKVLAAKFLSDFPEFMQHT